MDIDFTFAICHGHSMGVPRDTKSPHIEKIIESIRSQNIKNYEILIIGDSSKINMDFNSRDTRTIQFDDSQKSGKWLTRKKNILVQESRMENIVFIHNYVVLDSGWYDGFKKFGNNFDICVTHVNNYNGSENYTWMINPLLEDYRRKIVKNSEEFLIPKDIDSFSRFQYIPGNYWIAKKSVMVEVPLDERIMQGESEDCEWSMRAAGNFNFRLNRNSSVTFLRKDRTPRRPRLEINKEAIASMKSLTEKESEKIISEAREKFREKFLGDASFLDEI
tara:strand:+ start:868 stop:1695 length:828 start_codon:yes stop_codon:yes gene_type:complete